MAFKPPNKPPSTSSQFNSSPQSFHKVYACGSMSNEEDPHGDGASSTGMVCQKKGAYACNKDWTIHAVGVIDRLFLEGT